MARRRIIAGNWKMNMTPSQAVELVATLKDLVVNPDVDVVYCVPAIDIVPVAEAIKGTNVELGAENFYIEDKGAFTGEISAPMLKEAGVKYIIIGHSERRDIFGENDILINQKVKKHSLQVFHLSFAVVSHLLFVKQVLIQNGLRDRLHGILMV